MFYSSSTTVSNLVPRVSLVTGYKRDPGNEVAQFLVLTTYFVPVFCFRFKSKVSAALATSMLKAANRTVSEAGRKTKNTGSADLGEKSEGKKKKDKKEEKDDKFCRPGEFGAATR